MIPPIGDDCRQWGCGVGYQAKIDDLRRAAKAAGSAGEQVAEVDLPGAIRNAVDGMPGARCVRSLETLGNAWRGDIAGWVSQAKDYAEALTAAAQTYSSNEDAASDDFRILRGGGRPV